MENEIWKKIPGYRLYEASNMGRLKTYNWKNKKKEAIMKPALDNSGYLRTMLKSDKGETHTIKVHRIICQTFLVNHKNKKTVNHKNGIKSDNRLSNLEWATVSENLKHAYKNFLRDHNKGERNPAATLTDAQVIEIRKNYEYGKTGKKGKTKQQIADEYGTTFTVIKQLIQEVTWKHLL